MLAPVPSVLYEKLLVERTLFEESFCWVCVKFQLSVASYVFTTLSPAASTTVNGRFFEFHVQVVVCVRGSVAVRQFPALSKVQLQELPRRSVIPVRLFDESYE